MAVGEVSRVSETSVSLLVCFGLPAGRSLIPPTAQVNPWGSHGSHGRPTAGGLSKVQLTKVFVDNDESLRHHVVMAVKQIRPTKAELAILRVLWTMGPRSVRDIQNALNELKPTGYTTVLKLIQIMTEKGLVERDETCRPQIYRARYSQEQTQRQLLRDLIQRAFGGSVKALVMQALATKKTSPQDLEAIEKLLDRFEGGAK